jgi:hypothetical protein
MISSGQLLLNMFLLHILYRQSTSWASEDILEMRLFERIHRHLEYDCKHTHANTTNDLRLVLVLRMRELIVQVWVHVHCSRVGLPVYLKFARATLCTTALAYSYIHSPRISFTGLAGYCALCNAERRFWLYVSCRTFNCSKAILIFIYCYGEHSPSFGLFTNFRMCSAKIVSLVR